MAVTKLEARPMLNQVSLQQVSLHQADLWCAKGDLRGEQITCTAGRIWVTQEHGLTDYVLKPGEIFWVTRPGTLLVSALKDGQFNFSRIIARNQPGRN
jgi:hypothetical protein